MSANTTPDARLKAAGITKISPRSKAAATPPDDTWEAKMQRDSRTNEFIPNLHNGTIALAEIPDLSGKFGYDMMMRRIVVMGQLPGERARKWREVYPLEDLDISTAQKWVQSKGVMRLGKEVTHQALDVISRDRSFHPVIQDIKSQPWDGRERVDTWLIKYLGAAANEYTRAVGRMFLIQMVARVMVPGCKADYTLILEGGQGLMKSTVCAILAGEWFSDSMPRLDVGKDAVLHLEGKWLIELGELDAMNRVEASTLKAFLTRRVERYRPPFGRLEVDRPRQCCFIGSTNESTYLRDPTGNRRFWPVKVGKIDPDGLKAVRSQLFAEALAAYEAKEPWWPDRDFERRYIAPEQEARYQVDPWEQAIATFIADKHQATLQEIAHNACELNLSQHRDKSRDRICAILARLGWEAKRTKTGRFWGPIIASPDF